jgi:hypothetical protein
MYVREEEKRYQDADTRAEVLREVSKHVPTIQPVGPQYHRLGMLVRSSQNPDVLVDEDGKEVMRPA